VELPRARVLLPDGGASACEGGWERRRRRIAANIEEVALRLFAESGFRNVTVDEIAAASHVSSRTVARYFPAKMDILLAKPRRSIEVVLQALRRIDPAERPVLRSVWQVWMELAAQYRDELGSLLLWTRAAATAPEYVALALGEQHLVLSEAYKELIAGALGTDPASDIKAEVLAAAVEAAGRAVLQFWVDQKGEPDLERLFASAISALTREFAAAGAAGSAAGAAGSAAGRPGVVKRRPAAPGGPATPGAEPGRSHRRA